MPPRSVVTGRARPLPAIPTFRKEDWPFHWVTRTSGRYYQVIERVLKPLGLDVPEWRALNCLDEEIGVSISEIADACIIKLNTTTKIIQRMQAEELVVCAPRATDARVTEVRLTAKGRALANAARARTDALFAHAFQGTDKAEVAIMNRVLEHLFERLDNY